MNPHDEQMLTQWVQDVYLDTHRIVYRYGKLLIGRRCPEMAADLEDLVQETYCILHRKRHKLYTHTNVTGWLIVALRYNFENKRRKKKRNNEILVEPSKSDQYAGAGNPVEDAIFHGDSEALAVLRAAINDEEKFKAFLDFHINHVPIQTLADRYGKSYDAMKMQLCRTRKLCQIILEEKSEILLIIFLIRVTFFDFMT